MEPCLFCKIVAGEIPAHKIYEDENVIAFLDITPVNPGHTLVVPKAHSRNALDISSASWEHIMHTVHTLAPVIKKAVRADGVTIVQNNEEASGQTVFHTHVHITPRFKNDGHGIWKGASYAEGEADTIAQKIHTFLT